MTTEEKVLSFIRMKTKQRKTTFTKNELVEATGSNSETCMRSLRKLRNTNRISYSWNSDKGITKSLNRRPISTLLLFSCPPQFYLAEGFYITPNLDRSPNVRANEAMIANHAPHAILRFFEILIFLEFYMYEKYEMMLRKVQTEL